MDSTEQRRYMIGIGSNIEPAHHVAQGLTALVQMGSRLVVSRIIKTEPVGMISDHIFFNLVVYLETTIEADELKQAFNALEMALGRDRSDPDSAIKDRPLDLDILVQVTPHIDWETAAHEVDSYYRPLLLELVSFLAGESAEPDHSADIGEVAINGATIGDHPVNLK